MWNIFQIKTLYQQFSAQMCLSFSFAFLLTYSKLNWVGNRVGNLTGEKPVKLLYSLWLDCRPEL